jgi:hypothetical protein
MGHERAAWVVLLLFLAGLTATTLWWMLWRKNRVIGLGSLTVLWGSFSALVYQSLSLSPPAPSLYAEVFGEKPDTTIRYLRATRIGSTGDYRTFLQFYAPPPTVKHLLGNDLSSTNDTALGWSQERIPAWWKRPSSEALATSLPARLLTGHFGIRFFPDGSPQVRYFPAENLVQVHWGYHD